MSTTEQSFELLTLKQVFAEGKRSFIIPDYQRGYSWEEDQRKDLLKDIEYGMSGELQPLYWHIGCSQERLRG